MSDGGVVAASRLIDALRDRTGKHENRVMWQIGLEWTFQPSGREVVYIFTLTRTLSPPFLSSSPHP